ncbi:MAG: cytochrome b/b6 domain-containing protein [Ramlibacter sp.]|nr:cytochrome b/b6 domain-containing protein [Ramlibacter sp.]
MAGTELRTVRVWDLPTRLFHWALALCALGLLVTGKIGGEAMAWHARLGYAVASLLLFRAAWGVVGGHWSRFATFTYSPRVILDHLRGRSAAGLAIGHSPLGSASVYALLALLAAQVATGLFSADLEEFAGPLNVFVSNATARLVTAYHKNIGEPALIALVLLHVAAVAYYHLRRGLNLIGPMVHGDKTLAEPAPASRDDWRTRVLAAVLLILAAGAIAALVSLGGG